MKPAARKFNFWLLFGLPLALIALILEEIFRNPDLRNGTAEIIVSVLLGGVSGVTLYLIGRMWSGVHEAEGWGSAIGWLVIIIVLSFMAIMLLVIWGFITTLFRLAG